MELEIQEIIRKELPAHVGDVLRKRLEQAEKDANHVKTLLQENEKLQNHLKETQTNLDKTIAQLKEHGTLSARETAVQIRERAMDVFELKTQLAAVTASKDEIFRLVETFMKNPCFGFINVQKYEK